MISQLAARAAVKQFGANQQILIAGETCKQLTIYCQEWINSYSEKKSLNLLLIRANSLNSIV